MEFGEYKQMYRKTWSEKFKYLCIDKTRKRKKVKIAFSVNTKKDILNAFLEVKLFSFLEKIFS